MTEHLDVLIIGAGLSGISAGYYMQTACPHQSYAILEARGMVLRHSPLDRHCRPRTGEGTAANELSVTLYVHRLLQYEHRYQPE